jgi:hypothetical protein
VEERKRLAASVAAPSNHQVLTEADSKNILVCTLFKY